MALTKKCNHCGGEVCKHCFITKADTQWVDSMIRAKRGQCWVMDCPNRPVLTIKGNPDFCMSHIDRAEKL